ncbi:uncharacterized protein [Physcomitrium patens]|uniref:DUF642 domain-containing protein n=2 Tax=Physcomitrium patens TaxID=3218 RepID=A0A2K1JQ07_PHYPA|nr:uncharacterized protein LOC112289422 [Physcomitrium patens]PNR43617.1 hypothetical protein PHYPA_015998 [Physcomitrium patens]|eukprot:XP_024390386.1 uncharacterized protein LOC112289422 [Physcomitrella patens]
MGRPAQIHHTNCLLLPHQMTPQRRSSSLSSAKFGNIMVGKLIACIGMLLWAEIFVSVTVSSSDLDADLWESETGMNIKPFTAAAPSPNTTTAANSNIPKDSILIDNGDFEKCNTTVNITSYADSTSTPIPNWTVGDAGVEIIQGPDYKMSSFDPTGKYCIHLNEPTNSTATNGTQGSIWTTLPANPTMGKFYTVQFDTARMPNAALNLIPSLMVSSISGTTTNNRQLLKIRYNSSDSPTQITWVRQSFIYEGSGAATSIMFSSMSNRYGPLIDNVVILPGKHALSAAIPAAPLAILHRVCPIITAVVVMAFHCPQLLSFL